MNQLCKLMTILCCWSSKLSTGVLIICLHILISCSSVLYSAVLQSVHCNILHRCTAAHCSALHCIALQHIALHCIALQHIALHCIALQQCRCRPAVHCPHPLLLTVTDQTTVRAPSFAKVRKRPKTLSMSLFLSHSGNHQGHSFWNGQRVFYQSIMLSVKLVMGLKYSLSCFWQDVLVGVLPSWWPNLTVWIFIC